MCNRSKTIRLRNIEMNEPKKNKSLLSYLPIANWLPQYKISFLRWDLIAGVTLASFVLPEGMAYATLAGVPTYFGIYCCMAGGLFFALFTTSRQVAVGPTSSISLMIGSTVAVLSGGDPQRWAGIAELTALVVAGICILAFIFKLSSLVNFISESILLGFKAGAALSIMVTQLPKLFGVEGGGNNFFSRIQTLIQHLPDAHWNVFFFGLLALVVLFAGDFLFPGKPVSLLVVVTAILIISFTSLGSSGIHLTGEIPKGLPSISRPSLRLRDVDGVITLAFACFLMGYIETISAARTFALKNNYTINPRQELLSMGAANMAAAFSSAYVVSGGLSQSTVNDKSGSKTPLSLIVCSFTLGIILLYLTSLLKNLPEVILAVIVLHAVSGLIKIKELKKILKLNPAEFIVAMIAVIGVLSLGILRGVMLSVVMSLILLIRRAANPNVAVLGRIGDSNQYSDISRHPDNILIPGIAIVRIESSIFYFNSENILEKINLHIRKGPSDIRLLILDFSACSYVDLEGSKMILELSNRLQKDGIKLYIVDALSNVREILRKQGLEEIIGRISRRVTIADVVREFKKENDG
ncbi:MAG TPA: SulP family inorganic anion transporter [Puia sp.]|nr:SulP family inorganic anion transporter [Puia sp.]